MIQAKRAVLCAMGAVTMASPANAELAGLRVFREEPGGTGVAPPGPPRWIYRVYAEFTEPTDVVASWGTGLARWGFGGVWNVTQDGTPGSGFTNIPNDLTGDLAPFASGTPADWDTYMTIGVLYGIQGPGFSDYTTPFALTPLFITNGSNEWTGPGGVLLFGDVQQGFANYRVNGNDTDRRVLLMQLVVNAGEHVHGSIGLSWRSLDAPFVSTADVAFTSLPAPSATLILMLLGFRPNRKRR